MPGTVLGARDVDKIKVFTALRPTVPKRQQKVSSHIQYSKPSASDRGGSMLKKHLALSPYPYPEGIQERFPSRSGEETEEVKQQQKTFWDEGVSSIKIRKREDMAWERNGEKFTMYTVGSG